MRKYINLKDSISEEDVLKRDDWIINRVYYKDKKTWVVWYMDMDIKAVDDIDDYLRMNKKAFLYITNIDENKIYKRCEAGILQKATKNKEGGWRNKRRLNTTKYTPTILDKMSQAARKRYMERLGW